MIKMTTLKDRLKESIINSEWAASRREIVCRCPFCGHTSSINKKHMYISAREDKPIMYNCFKCNSSGIADYKFLQLLGIKDTRLIQEVQAFNSSKLSENPKHLNRKNFSSYDTYSINKSKYKKAFYTETDYSIIKRKLDYINGRLKTNLNQTELINQKVLLDIRMFYNDIRNVFTASESDMQTLMNEYIGFLSVDNSCLSLRHIINNNLPRWIIANVTNRGDKALLNKAFGIPTKVYGTNTIYISEGQFDILSVYNNLTHKSPGFYVAASGSKYTSTLEYIVEKFGLMNVNLEVFFDNDDTGKANMNFMKYYVNKFRFIYNGTIRFHMNKMSKDFGVPLNEIDDLIYQIY